MATVVLSSGAFRLSISDEIGKGEYALISLASEIGSAAARVYSFDLDGLVGGLNRLISRMCGDFHFESLEGDFALKFNFKKLGHIEVDARLSDVGRSSYFHATTTIDQSYLPDFVASARSLNLTTVNG